MSLENEALAALRQHQRQGAAEAARSADQKAPLVVPWVIELSQRISSAGYSPLPLYQRHNSQHDEIAVVSPLGGSGWMLHSEWPRSSAYDGHNGTERVAITEDGRIFRMNGFDRGVRDVKLRHGTTRGYQGVERGHRMIILCGTPDPIANHLLGMPDESCRVAIGVLGTAALLSGAVQGGTPGYLSWYMQPVGVLVT